MNKNKIMKDSSTKRHKNFMSCLRLCCSMLFASSLLNLTVFAQELDENWTVTVAGQTVQVNPDGTFRIPNILTPDQFGNTGPASPPDFFGDDLVRLTGYTTVSGKTTYVYTDHFQIQQGETYVVTNLIFTNVPPPLPVSITAVPDVPTLTAIGQQTQVRVTALYADGNSSDVTLRSKGSVYRISNLDIATVNSNGLVTALQKGTVFIGVVNDGATAIARIDISPGASLTALTGFVQDLSGTPISNVTISLVGLAGTATTDSEGNFTISGVNASSGTLGVMAQLLTTNDTFFGLASQLSPVPEGFTDAGIITAVALCEAFPTNCVDTDNDGLPDSLETALGYSTNSFDSNTNGISDGAEDIDGDRFSNVAELFLGTDLTDTDSDQDGYQDVYKILGGSDPATVGGDGSQSNPFDTIEAALSVAAHYDIIQVADGTYTGAGNRNLSFSGLPIMVVSENGPSTCVIDCEASGRGFTFQNGEDERLVLRGVTVRNGNSLTGGRFYFSGSMPMIQACIITENQTSLGGLGGGIYCVNGASPRFQNCAITKNQASSAGGGVYNSSSPSFKSCTLAYNSSSSGGGLYNSSSAPFIYNSILWANTPNQISNQVSGAGPVVTYSVVQDGWVGANTDLNPELVPGSYRLKANSPCIDAGSLSNATAIDIDGEGRWNDPIHTNAISIVDMGADEFVDTDGDQMADVWEITLGGSLS